MFPCLLVAVNVAPGANLQDAFPRTPMKKPVKCKTLTGFVCAVGAGKRSRTPDLRITNALLYQLSYAGTGVGVAPITARKYSGFCGLFLPMPAK